MAQNREIGELGQIVTVDVSANSLTVNGNIILGNSSSNVVINSTSISIGGVTQTDKSYTWTNTHTFTNTVSIAALSANGTLGISSQVLTTNGTGIYWSSAGVNTNATYTWSNAHTFNGVVTLAQTAIGTVNNSLYLGGTVASGYQTTAGLSANVATLTANNTSFVGSVSAANVVSNTQLQSNLANYATLSGATFSGDITINANLIVSGTTVTVNTATLDVKDKNITVAKGSTASASDGSGLTVDGSNIGWYYTYSSNTWTSNVGITPSANVTYNLGTSGMNWSNVYANNIVSINLYGTLQTASQPNITANNTSFVGTVSAANVVSNSQLSANLGNYAALSGATFTGDVSANNLSANTLKTTGGTEATRPVGSVGVIRYNSNSGFVETYTPTGWASFSISSIDYGTVTDSIQTSLDFGGVP